MVERALDKGVLSEEQIFAAEPIHRMGKPEEVAQAVLWLCSDASSFLTDHRCRSLAVTSRNRGCGKTAPSGSSKNLRPALKCLLRRGRLANSALSNGGCAHPLSWAEPILEPACAQKTSHQLWDSSRILNS
jgi:hypothetical protein